MGDDTDEEPPPPPPLAEVLPMTLQMAIQGTTVEELAELLSMETWDRLDDAERQQLSELLPPGDPDTAVRALFGREALQLARAPPLDLFWAQLNAGDFTIEGLKRNQAHETRAANPEPEPDPDPEPEPEPEPEPWLRVSPSTIR